MTSDSARIRKQRQRERQRAAAILAAESQAARIEADAERLAPAVMRDAVMAGARMLVGPRVQITNGRVTRADPIAACKSFTEYQRKAARQLQLDWNDVGAGIGVGAVDYLRTGGGGGCVGPDAAVLDQVHKRVRLEAAMMHLGAFAPSIARVVLDGVPISSWVQEPDPFGTVRTAAEGVVWIGLGLTRLSGFYSPPVEAKGVHIRTIGPARSAYEAAA